MFINEKNLFGVVLKKYEDLLKMNEHIQCICTIVSNVNLQSIIVDLRSSNKMTIKFTLTFY